MRRFALPVTLFFFIALGYFIFQYHQNIQQGLRADYEQQLQRHQDIINGYQINSDVTFENLVMQPNVLNLLRQAQNAPAKKFKQLHTQLHALLADKYQSLQAIAQVRQLHFHTVDGRSFLRMHRPEKFGDSLFDVRYSIKKTNTEQVRTQGFEEGRIFNGYRFVYPIIDRNQHLGSVEISLSMAVFTDSLSKVYQGTNCFMLDAQTVGAKVFAEEQSNYRPSAFGKDLVIDKKVDNNLCDVQNPLIVELANDPDLQDTLAEMQPYSGLIGGFWDFKGFVGHFVPIQNIQQKTVAYLLNIQRNEQIASLHNRFIYNLALSIIIFIVALLAIIAMNKRQQELEKHAEILDKTVKELSESYENLLHEQSYIKRLLETIFNVIDHLNRLGKVEKLLYSSCENLMYHDNYRFAHLYTYQQEIQVDLSQIAIKDGLKAPDLGEFYENAAQQPLTQSVLNHGELVTLNDLQNQSFAQPIIDYLQAQTITHAVFLPIQNNESHTYGFLMILSTQDPTQEERVWLKKLATAISQSITTLNRRNTYEQQLSEKAKNYKFILFEIVDLLEKRYVISTGRSIRVSKYAKKIALALNLDAKHISTLVDAAMLHDIGNIKIPDNILLKTEPLSLQERKMLEQHVIYGARLLENLSGFKAIHETILHHHEKFDGTGYPSGLCGQQIPQLSRILAVADAFEAMTSYWIYKPSKTALEAIAELESKKETQFDPQIVNIARHVLRDEPLDHLKRNLPTQGREKQRLQYLLLDPQSGLFDVRYLDMLAMTEFRGLQIESIQRIRIDNLQQQTRQQHADTLNTIGKLFKKFYADDLCFFISPNYLILIQLEAHDANFQSALFDRLENDKSIYLEAETLQETEPKDYLEHLQPLLEAAKLKTL